jgi:hypothetical protein
MFHIMFTVAAADATEWDQLWERFQELARELGPRHPDLHLSSHLAGPVLEDEEYFDETTMFKVIDALVRAGITPAHARDCVNEMQNAGILFRERGPHS